MGRLPHQSERSRTADTPCASSSSDCTSNENGALHTPSGHRVLVAVNPMSEFIGQFVCAAVGIGVGLAVGLAVGIGVGLVVGLAVGIGVGLADVPGASTLGRWAQPHWVVPSEHAHAWQPC